MNKTLNEQCKNTNDIELNGRLIEEEEEYKLELVKVRENVRKQ